MIEAFSGNMSDRVPGTFRTVVTPPAPPTTTTTTVPAPKPKNPLVSNLKSLHNLISKRKGMLLSKGTCRDSLLYKQHSLNDNTGTTHLETMRSRLDFNDDSQILQNLSTDAFATFYVLRTFTKASSELMEGVDVDRKTSIA